jgi:PHD/YefM family antitoxin component YafN of YafNO toxin-antitoxin module
MAVKLSTPITIPESEVHEHFAELIQRADANQEHFIVEKDGLPVIAMLPMQDYAALMQELEVYRQQKEEAEKEARVRRFRENARAIGAEFERLGITEEEALEQLEQVRKERRRK